MDWIENIKFDQNGLIPAIIQDNQSGKVLMLAYMNKESLLKTMKTGTTWFFSRSRQELWNKGLTSGNTQGVVEINYDCDGDTLLIKVDQKGVPCHTGKDTCFFNEIPNQSIENLLYYLIEERKKNPVEGSYTNYLLSKGMDKILKKIGEESSEVIIGAKNNSKDEVIYEISDLIYHLLVLLVEMNIPLEDIKKELSNRHK